MNKLTDEQESEIMAIGSDPTFTDKELSAHYLVPVYEIRRVRRPTRKSVCREIANLIEG